MGSAPTAGAAPTRTSHGASGWPPAPRGAGHLAPGSDPKALPGPILIADKGNDRLLVIDPQGRVRWQFPRRGDLAPGQTFDIPDDAFFSPDGKQIIATQEDDSVISVIDIAKHRIVWRYGKPGVPGSGPDRLHNPDDALLLPTGQILTADIKNCRLLVIPPRAHAPSKVIGERLRPCRHDPPARWGSPNGAFPMRNGHWLVTEINGDWVDELGPGLSVRWSVHPPQVAYPSDTNEIRPGRYLTVDYSDPGQVLIFDRSGNAVWRYRPTGEARLNHPSLALPLPNGLVLLNDDENDRVIVVDPHTNKVVWQYGVTRTPGSHPGQLDIPDGVDLLPPYNLLGVHAATLRVP